MKKAIILTAIVSFVLILTINFPSLAADYPKIKLKATSWFPSGSFTNKMLEWFVEEVTERSGGNITFETYWGGSLLKGGEALEGLQHGVTDFGVIAPAYTPGKVPVAYSNYAFPFAPRKAAVMADIVWQLYEDFPWMHDELKAHNIKLLYLGTVSDYGLLSREPMKRLESFKGKKIVQLGGYFADWTKASGIVPVSGITSSERYERLRTGVVDGSLLTPSFFYDYKEYEVAKYLTMTGLGARVPMLMVINMKCWNDLAPEVKRLFTDVSREVEERHAKETDEKMVKDIELLKKKGVKYHGYLPKEDTEKWASEVPDTPAMMCRKLEGQYPEIWKMAEKFIGLAEENGHNWPRKFATK